MRHRADAIALLRLQRGYLPQHGIGGLQRSQELRVAIPAGIKHDVVQLQINASLGQRGRKLGESFTGPRPGAELGEAVFVDGNNTDALFGLHDGIKPPAQRANLIFKCSQTATEHQQEQQRERSGQTQHQQPCMQGLQVKGQGQSGQAAGVSSGAQHYGCLPHNVSPSI